MTGRIASAGWLATAGMATMGAAVAAKPQLPAFMSAVAGPLNHYGLWAIGLLLLLENIGVPVVPGEFAMIAGAIYAGTGQLNVVAVGVTSVIASFAGAMIGYGIGRLGGRTLVLRYGKYVLIKEHHLDKAEHAVDRFGGVIVVVARFIVGLRELVGIISGVTGMRQATFATFNAIGAVAWVATWVSLGYLAGDHIGAIYSSVSRYALYVIIAAVLVLAAWIVLRLLRRGRRGPGAHSAAHARRQ
ncbi:MAG: DedA family protein [Nocardiopsaceae bacterium]|nr:DedA family protein [Nocardiopsaceae bacterium]